MRWIMIASTALLAIATVGPAVFGQSAPGQPADEGSQGIARLEQRILQLEQELEAQRREQEALQSQLESLQKPSDDKKAEESRHRESGYVVGSDLKMSASWRNGLEIQSANKDFRVHVGGRTQIDAVWIDEASAALLGAGGIGDADSVNFRRARLRVDGTMYEFIDWAAEYEFLNTVNENQGLQTANAVNTVAVPAVTDLWIDIKELPIVGHVRLGNFKEPIGLEHQNSSRFLDFIERSYLQDAYTGPFNNGFSPGAMIWDTSNNERLHYALGAFKNSNNIFAYGVGDGEYAVTGRLACLLWYDKPAEGRYLGHLGITGSHRDLDDDMIRIRSRGSLRSGPPGPLNPVLADTGTYFGDDQNLFGVEAAVVHGPWLAQAEYIGSAVNQSRLPGGAALGTTYSQGYYIQVLYFLTGEHRAYDLDRFAFGRVVPHENFFLVRGTNGICHGRGAWQIGGRYNYLDLRDDGLNGGIIEDWTAGLNWFLNPNMKFQWNYVLTQRQGQGGIGSGDYHGFGMRMAYDF